MNTVFAGNQIAAHVAMSAAGDFVVVWQGKDANSDGILAQRYDASGNALGGEFSVKRRAPAARPRPPSR